MKNYTAVAFVIISELFFIEEANGIHSLSVPTIYVVSYMIRV